VSEITAAAARTGAMTTMTREDPIALQMQHMGLTNRLDYTMREARMLIRWCWMPMRQAYTLIHHFGDANTAFEAII
jgi:hypothetical protein